MTHVPDEFTLLHLKRSLTSSRAYLIIGLVIPLIMIGTLYVTVRGTGGSALAERYGLPTSASAGAILLYSIVPAVIPLGAVIGSFSPLLLFVNDRSRGVYEYLLAFGKKPSDIFAGLVVSVVVISTILVIVPFCLTLGLIWMDAPVLVGPFLIEGAIYAIPMSYIVPLFITGIAAIWVSLTKRVQFVNSPIGVAPMFGLLPVMVVLVVSEFTGKYTLLLTAAVSVVMIVATVLMFALASKLLRGERFIV